MRSLIAVLLLAAASTAQPEPSRAIASPGIDLLASLLYDAGSQGGQSGLLNNLLGGVSGGLSGQSGLVESLLNPVNNLLSGLLGPILGSLGGSSLLGGGVGNPTSAVGDLVTCLLSEVLGQVSGLLGQVLNPVLSALGLSTPVVDSVDVLNQIIMEGTAGLEEVTEAPPNEEIDLKNFAKLISAAGGIDDSEMAKGIRTQYFDADALAKLFAAGVLDENFFQRMVNLGALSASEAIAIQEAGLALGNLAIEDL